MHEFGRKEIVLMLNKNTKSFITGGVPVIIVNLNIEYAVWICGMTCIEI